MSNKLRSILFAIGWYLTVILWFYALIPLSCIVEPKGIIAVVALYVGAIGLPILFWAVRRYWINKGRWNKWGTIVYIGLNFLTVAYVKIFYLLVRLDSPVLLINTDFISDSEIRLIINLFIVFSPRWLGGLLAIELMIAGIRLILRRF